MIIIRKIERKEGDPVSIARKYYSILFSVLQIPLTPTELDLVAFSSVKGTLSSPPLREEFMSTFKASRQSVYNMMSKLQRMKVLTKGEDKKIRVSPEIGLNFQEDAPNGFVIQVKIVQDDSKQG